MTTDLFKSKLDQIYDFIKSRGRVRTSEVIKFASSIYTNRGSQDLTDLRKAGRIRKISDAEKKMIYGKTREAIWTIAK